MREEKNGGLAALSYTGPRPWRLDTRRREPMAKLLVWKALFGLLAFDVLRFGHRFAQMHRFVSGYKIVRRTPCSQTVEQVCNAVNYACVWYPKRVLCLQRSAVTTCLLRHCGVPAKMVLGAQTLPFKAHAWTELNGKAINERRDVRNSYEIWERC